MRVLLWHRKGFHKRLSSAVSGGGRRLGSAAREGEDGVRVERGHCHITVPRLDLVLPLDALAQRARLLSAGGRILPEPPGEALAGTRRRSHGWLCSRCGRAKRVCTGDRHGARERTSRQRRHGGLASCCDACASQAATRRGGRLPVAPQRQGRGGRCRAASRTSRRGGAPLEATDAVGASAAAKVFLRPPCRGMRSCLACWLRRLPVYLPGSTPLQHVLVFDEPSACALR